MDPRERYLDELVQACEGLDEEVRQAFRDELSFHLDAAIEARLELGNDPYQAMADSVASMESPFQLGKRLRRVHLPPNPTTGATLLSVPISLWGILACISLGDWAGMLIASGSAATFLFLCHQRRWLLKECVAFMGILTGCIGAMLATTGGAGFGVACAWMAVSIWVMVASASVAERQPWRRWAALGSVTATLGLVLFAPYWGGNFWTPSSLRDARDLWAGLAGGRQKTLIRYDAAHGGPTAPVLKHGTVSWQAGASWERADREVRPVLVRQARVEKGTIDEIDQEMKGPSQARLWPALIAGIWVSAFSFLWLGMLHVFGVYMAQKYPKPYRGRRKPTA